MKMETISVPEVTTFEQAPTEICSSASIAGGTPVPPILMDHFILLIAQKEPPTLIDLQGSGFRAAAVDYTKFSLEAINSLRPGLIILDYSIPIHAAQTLGDFIKSHRVHRNIPILLLLRRVSDYPLPTGSSFRPDLSLIEPFTLEELRAGINFLLRPSDSDRL